MTTEATQTPPHDPLDSDDLPWEAEAPDAPQGEKIARLERLIRAYHSILLSDFDLSRSVDNLGTSAAGLTDALRQVDETQRQLAGLSTRVEEYVDSTPTKDDVEHQFQDERRRFKGWIFTLTVALVLTAGGLVFGAWMYTKSVQQAYQESLATRVALCEQRNEQNVVVQDYLDGQVERIQSLPNVSTAAKASFIRDLQALRGGFPTLDCQSLK